MGAVVCIVEASLMKLLHGQRRWWANRCGGRRS